jgi:hypothetical protein
MKNDCESRTRPKASALRTVRGGRIALADQSRTAAVLRG